MLPEVEYIFIIFRELVLHHWINVIVLSASKLCNSVIFSSQHTAYNLFHNCPSTRLSWGGDIPQWQLFCPPSRSCWLKPGMLCLFEKGKYNTSELLTCPANATDWFIKGSAKCYHVYVIMHVKDPQLFVIRVGHRVLLAGSCLSPCNLDVLNRTVNMIILIKLCDSISFLLLLYCFLQHLTA